MLAADTAEYPAIFKPVRHSSAAECVHYGRINKPAVYPLGRFKPLITQRVVIEVIDIVNAGHANAVTFLIGKLPQGLVEFLRAHVKTAMHGNATNEPLAKSQSFYRPSRLCIIKISI